MLEEQLCDFSREVWDSTFRYNNETLEGTFRRVSDAIASVEEDSFPEQGACENWSDIFYECLSRFLLCPAGRILANAGTVYDGTTLFNCTTSPMPKYDCDSLDGILEVLCIQAQTLKSEAGWGCNFSFIRPRGSLIKKIGVESPGAVKYMELFNKSSDIITSGSGTETKDINKKNKIRKGAQIGFISCWHPDVIEFIEAKRVSNRLDKFNVSVGLYNDFMDNVVRVEETGVDEEWELIFPDTTFERYSEEWNGDIYLWKSKEYPVKVYKKVSVKYLWELIMKSTYDFNDPGTAFFDIANKTHLLNYIKSYIIKSANPCVCKGTLINTPYGYKKVETIKVGDLISTIYGSEAVEEIGENENVPIFKVSFSDGGYQFVTKSHVYHTLPKDNRSVKINRKKLSDINIGDRVLVSDCQIEYSTDDDEEYKRGLKAGILLGDGCYNKDNCLKISTSIEDSEYNDLVKKLFGEELFNKDNIATDDSKSMSLCLKNRSVDLNYLGLTPQYCETKSIDYSILTNKSIIIGVLDGLLATDGNVNLKSNHPQLRWSTSSEKLAQTIRNLLLYLGCHGFIHTRTDIKGGTINGRKIVQKNPSHTITISSASFKKYCQCTRLNQVHTKKYNLLKTALKEFKLSGNCWTANVISIEQVENNNTYDLYCSGSDTYITSGYVQQGCFEQMLPDGSVCDLGSIPLPYFIKNGKINTNSLEKSTRVGVRFLDNINDYSNPPHESYAESIKNKRRIGLGIMGWGSLLYLMEIRFASDEAEILKHNIMSTICYAAVDESAELAKEKGCFVECDKEKLADHIFWDQIDLPKKIRDKIRKYGLRNSALFSIQPTGNTGVFMNVMTGGCEPVFLHEYIRTMIVQTPPDHLKDKCPSYWEGAFHENDYFKLTKEGKEDILRYIDEFDTVWKIDKNRGLTKEVLCEDYAVRQLKKEGRWNPDAEWAVTTKDLTVEDHVRDLKGFAKWIDSSVSKTVNVPHDYPYEDFKKVYLDAYKSGVIKGITTYREGTMTNVLASVKKEEYIKRPKLLPAKLYSATLKGEHFFIAIGLKDQSPWEVFAGRLNVHACDGRIIKIKRGHYNFIDENDDVIIENLTSYAKDEEETVTRLTSMALRGNIGADYIQDQLSKTQGDFHSFSKMIARYLKNYVKDHTKITHISCPECGGKLSYRDGCVGCYEGCLWSKCS